MFGEGGADVFRGAGLVVGGGVFSRVVEIKIKIKMRRKFNYFL